MEDFSARLNFSTAQIETDKALLEEIRTVLVLHKTAPPQRISSCENNSKNMDAERASLDVAFQNFCADSDSRILRLQTALETRRSVSTRKPSRVRTVCGRERSDSKLAT